MENKENKIVIAQEMVNNEGVFNIYTADKQTDQLSTRLKAMDGIGKAIKTALVQGINSDYDTIPGTNKPTLLQPGARKIGLLFGLVPEYQILSKEVDYNKKWTKTGKTKDGGYYNMEISGHFEYEVLTTLKTANGTIVSTGVGSCCNRENGKSDMPANSILKMAKKRSFIDAILGIADLSSVFTQDMEEIKKTQATSAAYTSYTRKY